MQTAQSSVGRTVRSSSTRQLIALALFLAIAGCSNSDDSCFVAGTPIATPNGDVAIETVRAGDMVLAYDFATSAVVSAKVVRTFRHEAQPYLRMQVGGTTLGVTKGHPIYDADGKQFVSAGSLHAGSKLVSLNADGSVLQDGAVAAISKSADEARVYNIEVEGHHNYFAAGVLVHNKSPADLPGDATGS